MGKKKKHEEHENLERWLVSYADFITLLFATFTALYALSVADLAKLKDVAQSIRDGFQSQSLLSGIESIINGQSQPSASTTPASKQTGEGEGLLGKHDSVTFAQSEVKKVQETLTTLKKDIQAANTAMLGKGAGKGKGAGEGGGKDKSKKRGVELSVQDRGIRISFDSTLLFEPGSAALREESKPVLGGIAKDIADFSKTNFIHIEGHTDNTPISTAIFPSNWELSSARASTVVRYLIGSHHFEPSHMAAVGYGETRPFTTNLTEEGRSKNRRIDIIVYGQAAGKAVDVRRQFAMEDRLVKTENDAENQSLPTIPNSVKPSAKMIQAKDSDQTLPPPKPVSTKPIPKEAQKPVFDPFVPSGKDKERSPVVKPHMSWEPAELAKPTHTKPPAKTPSPPSQKETSKKGLIKAVDG